MEKLINPKSQVEALFSAALENEKTLSVISGTAGNVFRYYDEAEGYERSYRYNDTVSNISERILMDSQIESFLPKTAFAGFLLDVVDSNAVMVMEKIVLLWDNDEGMSPARDAMENEYVDEYAQYIAEGDILGQTWSDRQIPVINVSAIYRSCMEIFMPDIDGRFGGFLQKRFYRPYFMNADTCFMNVMRLYL